MVHAYHLPPTLQTGEESDTLPTRSLEEAVANVEREIERFEEALRRTRKQLDGLREHMEALSGNDEGRIRRISVEDESDVIIRQDRLIEMGKIDRRSECLADGILRVGRGQRCLETPQQFVRID